MTIDELVATLCRVPQDALGSVGDHLQGVVVDDASLSPYVSWDAGRYTRNLIFRNDLFELLAVCWDVGSCSPIHNHAGQNCWLYVHQGTLCVDDYVLTDARQAGQVGDNIGVLRSGQMCYLSPGTVEHRGASNEIHRVRNKRRFNSRAVSLHVYSRPIDQCLVYHPANRTAAIKNTGYDTVRGVPTGATVQAETPAD